MGELVPKVLNSSGQCLPYFLLVLNLGTGYFWLVNCWDNNIGGGGELWQVVKSGGAGEGKGFPLFLFGVLYFLLVLDIASRRMCVCVIVTCLLPELT